MNKKILIGSIIAVGLLVLLSFNPVVGKIASDDELVDIDVEFCGLGKNHNVQLTQKEANEIDQFFDDIGQQLSEVETREETEEIFKDVIVELDKYGLLGGMSVERAYRIVTGKLLQDNRLCLVIGKTNRTSFIGPVSNLLYEFINKYQEQGLFQYAYDCITQFLWFYYLFDHLRLINFLKFGSTICIGQITDDDFSDSEPKPASGWINTVDLEGKKDWNGLMYGNLSMEVILHKWGFVRLYAFPGVFGFNGIRIRLGNLLEDKWFFIGFALNVKIREAL